jgi:hypothetical protein
MYTSDRESGSHGHLDRQPKKLIEEVYRSGVTAMKCHQRQDASIQWRSEKFKVTETFQTRLRIQRLVLKRLPIDRSSGSFSCLQQCNEIVWCMMLRDHVPKSSVFLEHYCKVMRCIESLEDKFTNDLNVSVPRVWSLYPRSRHWPLRVPVPERNDWHFWILSDLQKHKLKRYWDQ